MARPKKTERERVRGLILRALKNDYGTVKTEELFMRDWLKNIKTREMNAKDMQLIMQYLFLTDETNDGQDLSKDNNINIIVPDYMAREYEDNDDEKED